MSVLIGNVKLKYEIEELKKSVSAIDELNKKVQQLETQLSTANNEISKLKSANTTLTQQLSTANGEITTLKSQMTTTNNKFSQYTPLTSFNSNINSINSKFTNYYTKADLNSGNINLQLNSLIIYSNIKLKTRDSRFANAYLLIDVVSLVGGLSSQIALTGVEGDLFSKFIISNTKKDGTYNTLTSDSGYNNGKWQVK